MSESAKQPTESKEPLKGWRVYNLIKPHYLCDVGATTMLEPFEASVAECLFNAEHEAPADNCTCGIYSFTSFEEMRKQGYNTVGNIVVAEVQSWGIVQEHENCYKAQYCYPTAIYVKPNLAHLTEWLGQKYGVPCVVGSVDMFKRSEDRYTISSGSSITYTPPVRLGEKEMWQAVLTPSIQLSLRKQARQWLKQKYYMRLKAVQRRIPNLRKELVKYQQLELSLQAKQRQLDTLSQQWKEGGK